MLLPQAVGNVARAVLDPLPGFNFTIALIDITSGARAAATIADDLWNWYFAYVQGKGTRRDGLITLQNDLHIPFKVWRFKRGIPVKWTGPSMNANESRIAVEEIEIAHEGLELYAP